MRRFYFIIVFFLLIAAPAYAYLGLRLVGGIGGWISLATPFLLILAMPLLVWSRDRSHSRFEFVFSQLAFLSMGVLSFLIVFTVAGDLIAVVGAERLSPNSILIFTGAALIIGFALAVSGPKVKPVVLKYPDLPQALEGVRIALITDLHIGSTIREWYVRRVVEKTNALTPDLIALTGDIGDGRAGDFERETRVLGELKAKLGSFFVPGNHEYYWNVKDWIDAMNAVGIEALVNRGRGLKYRDVEVFVAGIGDPAAGQVGHGPKPDVQQAAQGSERTQFKILLSHRPGFAAEAESHGFDLQLSGHTHGGQFIPWTLVVRFVHRHSLGAYRLRKLWVYVSPGTGSWGPLLRLGTRPEITLIEIKRA